MNLAVFQDHGELAASRPGLKSRRIEVLVDVVSIAPAWGRRDLGYEGGAGGPPQAAAAW